MSRKMKQTGPHLLMSVVGALVFAAFVVGPGSVAFGEDLSSDQLVKSLKAKPVKRLTRGLGAPKVDKERIKSRGLVIEVSKKAVHEQTLEDRNELVKIVEKYKLPSIDLTIYFDYNSAKITPRSIPTLVKLGQALLHKDLTEGTFLVGGHTDAKGGDDYNLKLSQRRALAVKTFLIETFQIKGAKLVAVGFGEEKLKDVDYPESGENRRVQVTNLSH